MKHKERVQSGGKKSTILALIIPGATGCKFHSTWSYVGGLNVLLLFWHSRTALLNIINERSSQRRLYKLTFDLTQLEL